MVMNMAKEWQVNEDKAWFKKWWPENVPKNYDFEKITLGEFFDRQRKKYSNSNLIHYLGSWMTYEETGEAIDIVATSLHNLGLRKGDVVALLMPNCFQYPICFYACVKIGLIPTGINVTYKPIEVLHHLEITGAKAMITLEAMYNLLVKQIIDKTTIELIIYTNVADLVSGPKSFKEFIARKTRKIRKGKIDFDPSYNFYELFTTEPSVPDVEIDPTTHTGTYIMTGGTTGIPKATVLTHFNIICNAVQVRLVLGGEQPGMGVIGVLPMFHAFAITAVLNAAITAGGWMLLFTRPPPTEELLKTINDMPSPQGFAYPGAEILFKRIADFPDLSQFPNLTGKLKLCVSGAGPLHLPVQKKFQERTGGRVVEGYGLTESTCVSSAGNLFGESPIGTVGMPIPGTDWGIFDPDDFEKGPIADGLPGSKYGEEHVGEICVCGPQVMKEYLNRPEATADTLKTWDGRTWLLTGDIGFMRDDGCVKIRDRKKQLIKMAGRSVFPTEVETLLMKHDAVSEAAVAGLPDPEGEVGEIAKAWILLKPEFVGKITEDDLKAWAKENMAYWKVPAIFEFIEDIPKNLIGKVQRRALQEADPLYKVKHGK
ncbi:MAG: AMP-binding protein [Candidatus Hodarchaeota archaeon]